ncbi:MAG: single-stranded DNA-binding protein [Phycisphaerae bacterium]|nr:single-stranded DNA-binding protein [Phycisphaerae bacterium]
MASYNKVVLIGNLTRDPELRYLPSNTAVCDFGLAINHRYKDREGNQKEEVCFVDCSAFGKSGEIINQYMAKGRSLLVEGRLKLDSWTAQDGTKRSKHSIFVENFQFLGDGRRDDAGGGAPAEGARSAPRAAAPSGGRGPAPAGRREAPSAQAYEESRERPPQAQEEDIPF